MLKNTLKSTVSSFVIYLSILSPISAMSDDDIESSALSSSSFVWVYTENDRENDPYKYGKDLELGRNGIAQNIDEAEKIYKRFVEKVGEGKICLRLGRVYEKKKNFKDAFRMYDKAWSDSSETYDKAGLKYADCLEKELGTDQDLSAAYFTYKQIIFNNGQNADLAEAFYRIGFLVQVNPGELQGRFKRFYKDAAELGSKEAQYLMGHARKFRPDKTKAIKWFQEAARQRYAPAHIALTEIALKGHIVGQDEEAAFKAFQRLYDFPQFKSQWTNFFKLSEPQNAEEAFQLFKTNISTGTIESFLASVYGNQDNRQYISFLKLASEKGHPLAIFKLGQLYEEGCASLDPDPAQAFRFYLGAAQRRHPEAMFKVGKAYKNGRGTPRVFSLAFKWFQDAAIRGHSKAIKKQKELFYFLLPESLRTDYEGDCFNPHDHDIPVVASLYNHPDSRQAMMMHWNNLLNSPNRKEMGDISSFIIENRRALEISEDSDFFLEVLGKKAMSENSVDPKSPFKVWPALLQKRSVPVDVRSLTQDFPLWESEGRWWRFNPARLEDFGKEVLIDPTTVPEITQNDLGDALEQIQTKLTENPEAIQNALDGITKVHNGDIPLPFEDLKTFALGYNGRSFLMNSLSKDSIEGAQLKCVLKYIRSFSDEGEGLSSREVKLINFLMSVKACEIGQESGLTSYYQVYVPTPFKYSVTGDLFSHDHPEVQPSKYVFVSLIKEVVDSILNTDNLFMKSICKVKRNVPQLSHQALYLKTLIGDKIGSPLCRFDPSTACLTDGLLALSKEDGLRHFYEYILTNENLLKEVESKINQAVLTGNTYLKLSNLTRQWTRKNDENGTPQITRNGVLELLIKVGIFEEVLQEAFTEPKCSSSTNLGTLTDDGPDSNDEEDTPNIKRQRTRAGYQSGAI